MPAQGTLQMLPGTQRMSTASSPILSSPGPSGRPSPRLKLGQKLACSCQTGCHRTQGASSTVRLGAVLVSHFHVSSSYDAVSILRIMIS